MFTCHCKKYTLILSLLLLANCTSHEKSESTQPFKSVPRNRTIILGVGPADLNFDSFKPFMPGTPTGTGLDVLFEPLYFYNAYSDSNNIIPWIATNHKYNKKFTAVTINIRPGVTWSDGMPWTAHDLAFTINLLKNNAPELAFSTDMEMWVKTVEVIDNIVDIF